MLSFLFAVAAPRSHRTDTLILRILFRQGLAFVYALPYLTEGLNVDDYVVFGVLVSDFSGDTRRPSTSRSPAVSEPYCRPCSLHIARRASRTSSSRG